MPKKEYKNLSGDGKEQYLCDFVTRRWDKHVRETTPDRQRYVLAHNLFRGKMDWGEFRERYPWRAKIFVHLFSSTVRRMADTAQDLVFQHPDWFRLVPATDADKEFARIREKIVRYLVEQLDVENFSYQFFLSGGIYGLGIWKLVGEYCPYYAPEYVIERVNKQTSKDQRKSINKAQSYTDIPESGAGMEDRLMTAVSDIFGDAPSGSVRGSIRPKKMFEFKPKLYCINPLNFAYSTDADDVNDSPYTIEKIFRSFPDLAPYFESGFFDKSKREDVRKSQSKYNTSGAIGDSWEQQKMDLRDQIQDVSTDGAITELLEYFGDFLDENGDLIQEARHIVIANRKVVLRNAPIVDWDQRPPYGATIFSKIPGKAVGAGVADSTIDQNIALNELTSLFFDQMNLNVLGVTVFNDSMLDDPTQIEDGYFPGQCVRGTGKADDIFSQLEFDTGSAPTIFQMIQLLQQTGAQGTGVDVNPANPASRARITAQEIGANTDRAAQSQFALGREIDSNYIEPLIRAIDAFAMQHFYSDNQLSSLLAKSILTDEEYRLVSGLSDEERFNELMHPIKVEVKGFRDRLERDELLKRMNEAMTVVLRDPNAAQFVDMREVFSRYFSLLFPTEVEDDIILRNTPQDKAREENNILRNGQSVTILPNDDHAAELPVHYSEILKSPQNQAAFGHAMAHFQTMLQQGLQPPAPPKELEMMFNPGPMMRPQGGPPLLQ